MAKYTGASCPVCNKRFVETDDVVVCPICGAPHHRDCYMLTGQCALQELHISGQDWKPEPPEREQQADHTGQNGQNGKATPKVGCTCPSCGSNNPDCGLFCQICGAPLKGPGAHRAEPEHTPYGAPWPHQTDASYTDALGGLSPEEQIEGVSARDVALFIGPNARYFLPRFKTFAECGPISVNWPAFFFHFIYFFYRKMYLYGAAILGMFALLLVPVFFVVPEYYAYLVANIEDITIGIQPAIAFAPQQHLWAWTLLPFLRFAMIGVTIVFSLLANRLYLTHALGRIRMLHTRFADPDGNLTNECAYTDALRMYGRTSKAAAVAIIGGAVGGYMLICFLIAIRLVV